MVRTLSLACALVALVSAVAVAGDLKGDYLEARTCDVYTGPCFANGEGGLTGKDALMAWSIERGSQDGVALAGLKVVVAIKANETLAWGGTLDLEPTKVEAVLIVDEAATPEQAAALVKFAKEHAAHVNEFVKVMSAPIEFSLDHFTVTGKLKVANVAEIVTRKISENDCVCRNEVTFYPPLCTVKNANPAFSIEASYSGPGLESHWNHATSRGAFVATFSY